MRSKEMEDSGQRQDTAENVEQKLPERERLVGASQKKLYKENRTKQMEVVESIQNSRHTREIKQGNFWLFRVHQQRTLANQQ